MLKSICFSGGLALVSASPLLAHPGARIWIGAVNGGAVTLTSDNDLNPTAFTPGQVFAAPLQNFSNIWTTDFPGYEVRTFGGDVGAGTTFGFRMAGPLLMLDPTSNKIRETSEMFGSPNPGPIPQMAVSLGTSVRVTNQTVQGGFDFFAFNEIGDHAHMSYTLFGNGASPGGGPDGVYVLPLLLTSNSLNRSDWYFILLPKNATTPQLKQAEVLAEEMADALPGDADFSGRVDIGDFAVLAANFNSTGRWWKHGDSNFDGTVDIADFSLLASNFNLSSARTLAVPEPATAFGLLLLVPILSRRSLEQ